VETEKDKERRERVIEEMGGNGSAYYDRQTVTLCAEDDASVVGESIQR